MKNNLDIFIGTHKTFTPSVTNNAYKIICGNHEIENKSNLELIKCVNKNEVLDDEFFSEIYMLKWIRDNYELKDYVGFCHYRKYFDFMDDVPDVEEIFKEYDIITARPIKFSRTIKKQYASCHNIEDLHIIGGILADKYLEYVGSWHAFINKELLFPYNMFIMKKEDFLEYVDFIKGVLDEYVNIVGKDIENRIICNKEKYLKKNYPNSSISYQFRIGGYLAERLTNIFILHKFRKYKMYSVKITESKYKKQV